ADKQLISEALSRPIDAFVEKPVQRQQLIQLIEKTIERQSYLSQQMHKELFARATLGLQPQLPRKIGAFDCALRHCIPQEGGGDFVLLHQSQLLMADLMGHGLQAKTYVYALAGYLRGLCSLLSQQQLAPCKLLDLLSNGFADDPVLCETLATIAVINFCDTELNIASAGHPEPLLISLEAIQSVAVQGPLLGLSQAGYREQRVLLAPGQRLLLYSDGFLDAGEEMSSEMLNKLQYSAQLPLQQAADYLMQSVYDRELLRDDCTLVLLQLDPNFPG
ncbi:MAG: serine/threonine-protein phosphatase, partial [Pseudomonadales bacterium]|nr:serine/threonine-protein phosphatase [Pseudomonadales bacterium]